MQASGGQLRHNGLLSRILVIFNDDQDKMPYDSYMDVPEELVERWRNLIDTILDLTDGYYEFGEAVYTLSEDAKAAFSTWSDRNTDAVNEEADKTICEFFQKIKNYVYRFALVLQILEEILVNKNSDNVVRSKAMIFSTMLGDYLMGNARRVIDLLGLTDDSAVTSKSFQQIYDQLPDKFTKTQANEVARALGFSDSIVDKFCKERQGKTIVRLGHGQYQKMVI